MRNLFNISSLRVLNNNKIQSMCINYLLAFYIIYDIFIAFIACKSLTGNFNLALMILSTALISFAFTLDDIVAEVYGIKNSAIFYSAMVLTRLALAVLFYVFCSNLTIAKYLLFIAVYHPIIYTLAWYINVYLLTKWKILMQGKYFWLRSIGSSSIVITIFCILVAIENLKFSNWSSQAFISSSILYYIFRILFITIFTFPANFIVNILKIIEHQNGNTNELVFNPFKIKQVINE